MPIDSIAPWTHAYLRAQRALSAWIEADGRAARRLAFAARNAVMALAARERAQLARWVAWLLRSRALVARGLEQRLLRLDTRLARTVANAAAHLPALPAAPMQTARGARPTLVSHLG
ncbi:MAG: hypothetical protein M0P72_11900 [Metallibacterium scheffleri]|jgi:hypothetical protein|uniref:hypothetical protein n=1 Tax=Metallibacterium scheffleri TaxID=993689 RepID=UPI0026ED0264|nr:hypothetical protein [Metallibacterium scheffleri]MCK9367835.1 hypothetical protein [Metallibacterium scheffleri]